MKETNSNLQKASKKLVKCAIYLVVLVVVAGISVMSGVFDAVSDLTSMITIRVSTIVASVGIIALVVGFSAESLIADVVTGAFMLFENQYNVGDIVEIDNFRGTVTSIGIRTTRITDSGDNMQKIYENRQDVFKSAPSYLGVDALADSAVVLKFVVNVDEKDIYSGARLLNHDLLLGFRSLGVECPFPQLDVHHD